MQTAAHETEMTAWNPEHYLQHEEERTRPAAELVARIPLDDPLVIYDLGCGPCNSTALLHRRWPAAELIGVDNSEAMLNQAKRRLKTVRWQHADLATWTAERTPGLLFSNAAVHWLGDHETLLRRWMDMLASGGVLAIQMPRNFTSPSHTIIQQIVETGPWADDLHGVRDFNPVARPEIYYDCLADRSAHLDIWETEYVHPLRGENPVYQWISSTTLVPYLSVLNDAARADFLAQCREKIALAYRPRPDGTTLFSFRRLFVVAVKR